MCKRLCGVYFSYETDFEQIFGPQQSELHEQSMAKVKEQHDEVCLEIFKNTEDS